MSRLKLYKQRDVPSSTLRSLPSALFAYLAISLVLSSILYFSACRKSEDLESSSKAVGENRVHEKSPALSSQSCRECHPEIFAIWSQSHHAMANRELDSELDGSAFQSLGVARDPNSETAVRTEAGEFHFPKSDDQGDDQLYRPQMVIGYSPLRQYAVPFPGGRQQVHHMAWDPNNGEWFDVFEDEERSPDEWGHWSQRGMNWNSRCASCHMTFYEKDYDSKSDSYSSRWAEHGITCLQCHGRMEKHAATVAKPNYERDTFTSTQMLDSCASCHSRREELTGSFKVGDSFHDHFRLTLPTHPDLYYPDGQIREEVYVYGSLKMSRMGQAGVTCLDCHDPHSGGLKLPVETNGLCLSCHDSSRQLGAPRIDPVAHSRHPSNSTGNRCVECHMSATTYMQRDPRRDHGFIIPDPVLTKELGLPNACNRCHIDRTVDWAIEWSERWFEDRKESPARERARIIARAYLEDPTVLEPLATLVEEEENSVWKAALITLAGRWSQELRVRKLVHASLNDSSPLVRSASIRALATHPHEFRRLEPLSNDPARLVRIDTTWALINQSSPDLPIPQELARYIEFNADQPPGADRKAQLAYRNGNLNEAEKWFQNAVQWDRLSPGLWQNLALFLNACGKYKGAIEALEKARKLDSSDPSFPYMTALIHAESNNFEEAERYFRLTLEADPEFARAWYNLSLLFAQAENIDDAIAAIEKAETIEPDVPDHPYVKATLYLRQRKIAAGKTAAQRALKINPNYSPARQFLQSIRDEE